MTTVREEIEDRLEKLAAVMEHVVQHAAAVDMGRATLEMDVHRLERDLEAKVAELERARVTVNYQYQEIADLRATIDGLQKHQEEFMKESHNNFNLQQQLLRLRYEGDTQTSKIRSLERELSSHRVDMEHARMTIQQLRRELSACAK